MREIAGAPGTSRRDNSGYADLPKPARISELSEHVIGQVPELVERLNALVELYANRWGFSAVELAFIEGLPVTELVRYVQEVAIDRSPREPSALTHVRHALILRVMADTVQVLKEIDN